MAGKPAVRGDGVEWGGLVAGFEGEVPRGEGGVAVDVEREGCGRWHCRRRLRDGWMAAWA